MGVGGGGEGGGGIVVGGDRLAVRRLRGGGGGECGLYSHPSGLLLFFSLFVGTTGWRGSTAPRVFRG